MKNPPYFEGMRTEPAPLTDIKGARILGIFGDSITTDHISPAGSIKKDQPGRQISHGARRPARRTSIPTARGAATMK